MCWNPHRVSRTRRPRTNWRAAVAFVTGGTRGIGAAIAHSLADQGATVAVGYNRDSDSAERFVADLLTKTKPHGGRPLRRTKAMSAPPATAAARSMR